MKKLIVALSAAALAGCAAFDKPAEFALERYDGETPFQQLLSKVNLEQNFNRPCAQLTRCQEAMPSRGELRAATFLDCKGYTMAKAYALQDAGIDEARLRIAQFDLFGRSHAVLVIDERYVLDNFYDHVRGLDEYQRFAPQLAALPGTLMAEGRRDPASAGR